MTATPTLEDIAGELFGEPDDEQLKTCMSALLPVVRKLVKRGMTTNAIVNALVKSSVATLEQKRR